MSGVFGYSREAVRVKVRKCEGNQPPEMRKFSVDPQITSFEVLQSILAKAFDLKGDFTICYRVYDVNGHETYMPLLSDWDLDVAFLKAHNTSVATNSEPCLCLRVDLKPFEECSDDWDLKQNLPIITQIRTATSQEAKPSPRLHGIFNQMGRTLNMVQRAFNFGEDGSNSLQPPRPPLSDSEFRRFLDPVGQIIYAKELRSVIYFGGIDPSLRKVVWKHLLNVYPEGMTGRERMDYIKKKALEYIVTIIRISLPFFNILTTYALNHPKVSYCQGMSDLASPLLVTMSDEAHAYICFLRTHAQVEYQFHDRRHSDDSKIHPFGRRADADDLLFCYRWLLLEMKREFAFEDSLRMLEVLWSSLPADPPEKELKLYDVQFQPAPISTPPISPLVKTPRENPYTKVCALRRQSSSISLSSYSCKKTTQVKRQNHSLDESISKCRNYVLDIKFKHQSLDDTALIRSRNRSSDVSPKSPKHHNSIRDDSSSRSSDLLPVTPNSPKSPKAELRPRSVSPLEQKSDSVILNNKINSQQSLNKRSGSLSSSMTNLIRNSKKSGHFKELKEKIAAAKLFSSLDRLDSTHSIKEEEERKPKGKMVKNLNEFLNFGNVNKSKMSDDKEKPKILLTKSSFDDSESSSVQTSSIVSDKIRHLSSTSNSCDDTFDETSPDDSQEYFPMTTSVTRELRLELENLDRKVFGNKYVDRLSDSPSSDGNSETKTEKENIISKIELQENDIKELKEAYEKRKSDDIFLWENPLHQASPNTANRNASNFAHARTPDEQAEIEYDAPSIVNETSATKTITPIRIVNQTSKEDVKDETEEDVQAEDIPEPPPALPKFTSITMNGTAPSMTNSCEEVTESAKGSSLLPPPNELGGGNPFLMFLCITVLMQHRDHIVSKAMDYNEMAMHFDKMVRKHNVIRVLNQARQMYARYIKQHSIAQQKAESRNEDC
ncbi:hypothetical protein NQ318_007456 [Aromia moschata]|uniref:Rab-GAP TBC domain-containing protein n=1 Tax=Aromia moschata TaxID=1265417 RepID=A0AAV8YNI0_9CUCU|nr:hypothetical protein NQ318_007456 [Aromia moschata]